MLVHQNLEPQHPKRVVIIGARGFLGRAMHSYLEGLGVNTLGLTSDDVDLCAGSAAQILAGILRPDDAVVMMAALTPDKGKDINTMIKNLVMADTVCEALIRRPCAHVVCISSVAVYSMGTGRITEDSCAASYDLYGTMHKTREMMFQNAIEVPLAILRPTLVYGAEDTHNSYGANRFRRVAASEGSIIIGGNGEEKRDHIYVGDVAKLVGLTLFHRSRGVLNVATGRAVTFHDLAHLVADQFEGDVDVVCSDRTSPITHRAFDVTHTMKAFPKFVFTSLEQGIARVHREALEP